MWGSSESAPLGEINYFRRGLALLAGLMMPIIPAFFAIFGFAVLPKHRLHDITRKRAPYFWILSALLLAFPLLLTGHLIEAGVATLHILAIWCAFSSAAVIRASTRSSTLSTPLVLGLLGGLAFTLILAVRASTDNLAAISSFPFSAVGWGEHSAAVGNGIVILATLLALIVPSPWLRVVALAIGGLGAMTVGSQFTVLTWLVLALGLRFVRRRGTPATRKAEWVLIFTVALSMGIAGVYSANRASDGSPTGNSEQVDRTLESVGSVSAQTSLPAFLNLRQTHFPVWRHALDAISQKPILGWGLNGLPLAISISNTSESVNERPNNSRNALLEVWVERGALGAVGLVLLFALISMRAIQQRDRAAIVVLTGVVLLNTFDATLLSGSVIYPLAATLGWRSVGRREYAATETGAGSATAVRVGLALTDIAVGICSLSVGMYLVGRFDPSVSLSSGWSLSLAYSTLIWPAVSAASRLYPAYGIASYRELALAVRSGTISAILVGFTALVAPDLFGLDTTVFLLTVPISAVLLPVFRAVAKKLLQSFHLWGRPVVIVGTEPTAARITRHLLSQPGIGLHPVAAFGQEERWGVEDLAVSGDVQQAWDYIRKNGSRHLIVTREAASTAAFDEVLLRFSKQLEFVQYLPDLDWLPTNSVVATPIGTSLALRAQNQLASRANRTVKRTLDIVGSSVLLTFLGLPLLLLGFLIRLDSRGPAIYLSPRTGRDGKVFNCIKFRTMHVDADERLALLLDQHPELRAEYEKYHKLTNDPRITRLGRLIRKVSLDELPQLINVFLGQMSLVGPRPYMVREFDIMGEDRDLIFLARPGMTGYWQVDARNDVSFEERQAMEAHYVRNWTVWWDIDLLLRTPGVMLGKTGS